MYGNCHHRHVFSAPTLLTLVLVIVIPTKLFVSSIYNMMFVSSIYHMMFVCLYYVYAIWCLYVCMYMPYDVCMYVLCTFTTCGTTTFSPSIPSLPFYPPLYYLYLALYGAVLLKVSSWLTGFSCPCRHCACSKGGLRPWALLSALRQLHCFGAI